MIVNRAPITAIRLNRDTNRDFMKSVYVRYRDGSETVNSFYEVRRALGFKQHDTKWHRLLVDLLDGSWVQV
jgi:hypothetical protein